MFKFKLNNRKDEFFDELIKLHEYELIKLEFFDFNYARGQGEDRDDIDNIYINVYCPDTEQKLFSFIYERYKGWTACSSEESTIQQVIEKHILVKKLEKEKEIQKLRHRVVENCLNALKDNTDVL